MRFNKFSTLVVFVALTAGTAFAGSRTSEPQILAGVQDRIYRAHVFQHGQVVASYNQGVVTLAGTVDNLGSKLDAEKAARKVPGVKEVVDQIQVRADDVSPRQILEEARKQIVTYYAYGIFDNVNLQFQAGTLAVSGQVTQPFKKQDIGNFLERVEGVAAVENDLEVLPNSFFDDRLRLAVARAIYGDPYFVYYRDQAIPPIHIIVNNGNVTLEGVVASQLDRTKAEMAARLAGSSFSVTDNLRVVQS